MSLNAIRRQENPDGKSGHDERQRMKRESKATLIPKRVFTKGRSTHAYSIHNAVKTSSGRTNLLNAEWFCRELCTNTECPLRGV